MHPPHRARGRPRQAGGLPGGHPALYRVPRAIPRRPGRPLAVEPRPHDAGRAPGGGRSPVPDRSRPIPGVRVRHRPVPGRRARSGRGSVQPGRRRGHGRLRRRRPARPGGHRDGSDPGDVDLPQPGGRHLRGPERVGGRDRPARRPGLLPDRLQQRRPAWTCSSPGAHGCRSRSGPRCSATTAAATSPTSRPRPAWPSRSTPTPPPGPTTTTTAGSTSSSPARNSRATSIATGATAPSRRSPPASASPPGPWRSTRGAPGSTTTTTATPTCSSTA